MEITVHNLDGKLPVTVLRLNGEFDGSSYADFDKIAQNELENGAQNFVVDFSEVPYMSSAGVRSLNTLYKQLHAGLSEEEKDAAKKGIRSGSYAAPYLKLVNPSDKVCEVLKMTGLEMYLGIYNTEAEALATF
jgi:anti-anti-sigma regulatory factor